MSIPGTLRGLPDPAAEHLASRSLRRTGAVRRALACALALGGLGGSARAQSLLLGPAAEPAVPVPVDPGLPTGEPRFLGSRPITRPNQRPACSFRWPVCVRRQVGVPELTALRALTALERAMQRLVWGLGLPMPLLDAGDGPDAALDLYLTPGTEGLRVLPSPKLGRFDRASAFCVVGAEHTSGLDRITTLCVAEAVALRLDAAATPHVRRAYATHVWWAVGSPSGADLAAVARIQKRPQLATISSLLTPFSEGAGLLFEYLESRFLPSSPAVLATSLLGVSGGRTPPGAWRFRNEPDLMDVLRATFELRPVAFPELLGDFAVTRALMGGALPPIATFAWAQPVAAVRYDWTLPLSTLPRNVAFRRPVEPTGLVAVWVPFDEPFNPPLTIAVRAEWEPPTAFQWVLVRVGLDGSARSKVMVPFQERGAMVEQRIVGLEGLKGLLIVGTNLGGIDLAHPFDPDIVPVEPAGGAVYVTRL